MLSYYREEFKQILGIVAFSEFFRLPLNSNLNEIAEIMISHFGKLNIQTLTFCVDA